MKANSTMGFLLKRRGGSASPAGIGKAMLLVCLGLLLAVAGCGKPAGNAGAAKPADNKPQIAGIVFQEDQFFRLIEYGMRKAAEEQNVSLLLGNSFGAVEKESSLVETYTTRKVGAIAIAPLSQKASIPALQTADAQGIPIVTFDGGLAADFPKSTITSDQESLGSLTGGVAKAFIEQKLGGKAKVGIVAYMALSPEYSGARTKGFKDAIKALPGVEIAAEQDAWLAPAAADVVAGMLTARPDINIIWAANEGGTVGAVTAVKAAGKAGQVFVFGTDMSDQLGSFLLADDNILQALTGQKPFDIGHNAIINALHVMRKEPVERKVLLPGVLFQRDKPDEVKKYMEFLHEVAK